MEIRELQKNQIRNALDLVRTVFQEFEAPDYSKEGIEWYSIYPYDLFVKVRSKR